jgi:cbb3-type cytochrome oxidase subunit 3
MNYLDIILLIIIGIAIAAVCIYLFRGKKKGNCNGCCSGCQGCNQSKQS